MTKYRTVNNGHWEVLQYEVVTNHKFLWRKWTTSTWKYVWKPYYDKFYGRNDGCGDHTYINSLRDDIKKFIEMYPDVEEYFKISRIKQKELEDIANKFLKEIEDKKNQINYIK